LLVEFLADETRPSKPLNEAVAEENAQLNEQDGGVSAAVQKLVLKQMQKQNELLSQLQSSISVELPTLSPWEVSVKKEEYEIEDAQATPREPLAISAKSEISYSDSPFTIQLPTDLFQNSGQKLSSSERIPRVMHSIPSLTEEIDDGSLFGDE
jgi:hypothetical protein